MLGIWAIGGKIFLVHPRENPVTVSCSGADFRCYCEEQAFNAMMNAAEAAARQHFPSEREPYLFCLPGGFGLREAVRLQQLIALRGIDCKGFISENSAAALGLVGQLDHREDVFFAVHTKAEGSATLCCYQYDGDILEQREPVTDQHRVRRLYYLGEAPNLRKLVQYPCYSGVETVPIPGKTILTGLQTQLRILSGAEERLLYLEALPFAAGCAFGTRTPVTLIDACTTIPAQSSKPFPVADLRSSEGLNLFERRQGDWLKAAELPLGNLDRKQLFAGGIAEVRLNVGAHFYPVSVEVTGGAGCRRRITPKPVAFDFVPAKEPELFTAAPAEIKPGAGGAQPGGTASGGTKSAGGTAGSGSAGAAAKATAAPAKPSAGEITAEAIAADMQQIVKEFIPLTDELYRALESGAPKLRGELDHMQKSYNDALEALRQNGVEIFGSRGDRFDPARHEAVQQETDRALGSNTVSRVLQRGYTQNGKLVRPARVVVANCR